MKEEDGVKIYEYEEWDIKEGTEHFCFDKRRYVDLSGNLITGVLKGFYVYRNEEMNVEYVRYGKVLR